MKIIIGTESFLPNISGVSVASEALASNLAERGHQVFVFAPAHEGARVSTGSPTSAVAEGMVSQGYPEPALSDLGSQKERGAGYEVVRFRSVRNPLRKGFRVSLFPGRAVEKAVEQIEPDILHLQDPASICSSLLKVAEAKGTPVVVSNHFNLEYILSYFPYLKPLHPLMRMLSTKYLRDFYNRCDFVICPTETVKTSLEAMGINREIRAVSNGVDLERFFAYPPSWELRERYSLGIPSQDEMGFQSVVLYMGRMDPDKDLDTLFRAIPRVLRETEAQFIFCGDGNLLEGWKETVSQNGMARHVRFLGSLKHRDDDLPRMYQLASILVTPCPFETQSLVALEGMACGLPVVAANGGALPELVEHGVNGLLFPPGDAEALAGCLVKLLKDPSLAKAMGERALAKVAQHNVHRGCEIVETIYKQLIETRNGVSAAARQ